MAIWRLFEELLYDPEIVKAGKSIFYGKNDLGLKNWMSHYGGKSEKNTDDCIMEHLSNDFQRNKARIILRRYISLIANKELRQKVFGI